MKINKKVNVYKIYCEFDKNEKARRFAEKHLVHGSIVEVRAHGSLLSKNPPRVTITFKSREKQAEIYRAFLEEFKNHDIRIARNSLSVYKEVGFY